MRPFDLISDTASNIKLLEYDNVSMASLGLGRDSTNKKKHKAVKGKKTQKKQTNHILAFTPSSMGS